ncbi:MAG: C40 family peptidase [Clostridia bacterium]|nr:C40 family peptidase [Clostridia bacterium]
MNDKINETCLREQFVQTVTDQVGKGVYVWGGNGEILDDPTEAFEFVERHETSEENIRRALGLIGKRMEAHVHPIRAFDCSGLVYWALHSLGLQKTDVSSRGLYALCRPIAEDELIPGDLVFRHDGKQIVHVGVCVGSEQVECRGRDVGVVKNRRRKGYWNRFGRLNVFGNGSDTAYVRISGGSVRVREGDGTATRCIGIVHRGERYPLLGRGPSGWYCILWRGVCAYVTNKPQYTEVCNG